VRKLGQTFFYCFFIFSVATASPSFASEELGKGVTSHISVGMGWETLNYREHEPDTQLDSEADISNWKVGFDALKRWEYIFCGIKGIIPVYLNDDREDWSISDILVQQNSLEYGWSRIDAFLGYPLNPFFNPYIGIRWSEAKQERTGFVFLGAPVGGSVTETITAWFFTFGVTGNVLLNPRWRLSYSGSYFEPISSDVTNTGLPGWDVSGTDGYTFDFESQIEYIFTSRVSLVLMLYGGKMHWNGSDWIPYESKFAKWPENDTRYLGCMLNMKWSF
jgi:opacity protein-like surface antigen